MAETTISDKIAGLKRRAKRLAKTLADTHRDIHRLEHEERAQQLQACPSSKRSNRQAPPGVKKTTAKGRVYYYSRLTGERISDPTTINEKGESVQ